MNFVGVWLLTEPVKEEIIIIIIIIIITLLFLVF